MSFWWSAIHSKCVEVSEFHVTHSQIINKSIFRFELASFDANANRLSGRRSGRRPAEKVFSSVMSMGMPSAFRAKKRSMRHIQLLDLPSRKIPFNFFFQMTSSSTRIVFFLRKQFGLNIFGGLIMAIRHASFGVCEARMPYNRGDAYVITPVPCAARASTYSFESNETKQQQNWTKTSSNYFLPKKKINNFSDNEWSGAQQWIIGSSEIFKPIIKFVLRLCIWRSWNKKLSIFSAGIWSSTTHNIISVFFSADSKSQLCLWNCSLHSLYMENNEKRRKRLARFKYHVRNELGRKLAEFNIILRE